MEEVDERDDVFDDVPVAGAGEDAVGAVAACPLGEAGAHGLGHVIVAVVLDVPFEVTV